jgi:hypothetical protein
MRSNEPLVPTRKRRSAVARGTAVALGTMTAASVTSSKQHSDGSPCPEGTQCVPRVFRPCCGAFAQHTSSCYFDIRYEWWPKRRGWFIVIAPDAGGALQFRTAHTVVQSWSVGLAPRIVSKLVPNPSLHPTSYSWLGQLPRAGELKR